jgi:hypothetical protein
MNVFGIRTSGFRVASRADFVILSQKTSDNIAERFGLIR